MAKKERIEKVCLTTVKAMGFTDRMIKELLPEPELKKNPIYACAAPMKLWVKTDVEAAMKSEAFQRALEKREKRKMAAEKAVKTKKDKLMEKVQKDIQNITVKRRKIIGVRNMAINERQRWYDLHDDYENLRNARTADEWTIQRWMVNYIRHHLTSYDQELWELAGKTGKHEAYYPYYEAVMKKIAEVYPELKDECMDQLEFKMEQKKDREYWDQIESGLGKMA